MVGQITRSWTDCAGSMIAVVGATGLAAAVVFLLCYYQPMRAGRIKNEKIRAVVLILMASMTTLLGVLRCAREGKPGGTSAAADTAMRFAGRTGANPASHATSQPAVSGGSTNGQLAELLRTNRNCRVRLTPSWTGEAKVTVRTGSFLTADSPAGGRREDPLRFDWFAFNDPAPVNGHFGKVWISKDEGGSSGSAIHTFRSSLPTDDELLATRSVTELEKRLGLSQGWRDAWGSEAAMYSTAGWSFFLLKDSTMVETVSIFCMTTRRKGEAEWRVDSMRITRGTARPKAK